MEFPIQPFAPMPLLRDPPPWNGANRTGGPTALGHSVLGNVVNLYGERRANLLVMGGVHGDESEGIFLSHLLLSGDSTVPVIPCLNPDGALLRQRWNRNNVDLNRNLPTRDWEAEPRNTRYPPGAAPASEPETQAFLEALKRVQPTTVISLHSFRESFVEIQRPPDALPAPVNEAVDAFARAAGIERRLSIGYDTPGALGSFGLDNGLLVITYELRRGSSHGELYALLPDFLRLLQGLEANSFKPRNAPEL